MSGTYLCVWTWRLWRGRAFTWKECTSERLQHRYVHVALCLIMTIILHHIACRWWSTTDWRPKLGRSRLPWPNNWRGWVKHGSSSDNWSDTLFGRPCYCKPVILVTFCLCWNIETALYDLMYIPTSLTNCSLFQYMYVIIGGC